jgi:hypothetical protein
MTSTLSRIRSWTVREKRPSEATGEDGGDVV